MDQQVPSQQNEVRWVKYPLQAICTYTHIKGEAVWLSIFDGESCRHESYNEAAEVTAEINRLLLESLDKAKKFAYNRFIY